MYTIRHINILNDKVEIAALFVFCTLLFGLFSLLVGLQSGRMDTSSSSKNARQNSSTLHIPIEEIIEEVRKELESGVHLTKHPLIGKPKLRSFRLQGNEFHWV